MNPTLFEISMAAFMLAVSFALVVWFLRYMTVASERRTMHMLACAGVNPVTDLRGDTEAIMRDVRRRCRRCPSEGLCDRWLARSVGGDNSFCPNAHIIRNLKNTARPIAL
jgi:hypothetical protein